MKFLFIFLDGVGLGRDDPSVNPFAAADMRNLQSLLDGKRLLSDHTPLATSRTTLIPLDACLGVPGLPQSATGQATLLTGRNVPAALGWHYGPKPNPAVAEFLRNGNLFEILKKNSINTSFLNAYPPGYFEAIASGRRMYSAIPLAITSAGLALKTVEDLFAGKALSADLTGRGWRDHLNFPDTPVLDPYQAGVCLSELSQEGELSFFEYWLSDYAGHHQRMEEAVSLLETIDGVLGGLLSAWNDREGLILLTSDHGNLEDLSTRRHTYNPVPAVLIGAPELRAHFANGLINLAGVAPAILRFFGVHPD